MSELAIKPQPGFQEKFAFSKADITIGGGSAGCGKSYIELLLAAKHYNLPGFAAVFFRRNTTQIRNPGGLWDESAKIYPLLGARPINHVLEWRWPSTAKVKMAHLEHEHTVHDWQGAQVPLIVWDELTHFLESQFWYLLSRNRSVTGVRSKMLASCNPDADSWVASLIAWWIEQDPESPNYGFPIESRAGVLRYFTRIGDQMIWGATRAEVMAQAPLVKREWVKSLTFIPGKLSENVIFEKADPSYRGNLMAMSRVERARLLDGNWKVKATAGDYFKRSEVHLIDVLPDDIVQWIRRWDLAATEPSDSNPDPDYTVGVLMGRRRTGRFVIADVILTRRRSDEIRQLVQRTAENDGTRVRVGLPQDPGQAGVDQIKSYTNLLAGFAVVPDRETGDKQTRAEPVAAQWQAGNIDVLRAAWNGLYFQQMESFPTKGAHDDAVDATSGAFGKLVRGPSILEVL